jgi:bifunctional ADP-heptose synthase (sugar kinase/adenylyltransferase)
MTATESTPVDPRAKVLLIGDLLIDRTFYVNVSKLSPEAPIPVAMLTGRPADTPGGAGLAAAYAATAQIPLIFATYTSVETSNWMSGLYSIPVISPTVRSENTNAIKIRYIDNERYYHLLRVDSDRTTIKPFQDSDEEQIWFDWIQHTIETEHISIVTLLDYRKGLFDKNRSQRLIAMAHNANIPVYTDSRRANLRKFLGTTILKLNSQEYQAACRKYNCKLPVELATEVGTDFILRTKGANGAEMWDGRHSSHREHIAYTPDPSKCKGSPDVTGCGDVFDVTFCYQWGIKKVGLHKAIRIAVEAATQFAYEPIGERLTCRN